MRQNKLRATPAGLTAGRWLGLLLVSGLGVALAACEASEGVSASDRLSGTIPRPQKVTDARAELGEAAFPNLATVPNAPPPVTSRAERSAAMAALEADRSAAGRSAGPRSAGAPGGAAREHIADIYFAQASALLDTQDQEVLRAVAELFRTRGGRLHVVGHSSEEVAGVPDLERRLTNFQISLERARGVAEALERLGVAADRLLVEALTDRDPVYGQSTPEGAAGNRRVEIFQELGNNNGG
ncbi:MAG: OmpA family protein [Kiloniellales bacterium]|nr:OmpA family protein [Kiloniellales bacterium]